MRDKPSWKADIADAGVLSVDLRFWGRYAVSGTSGGAEEYINFGGFGLGVRKEYLLDIV